MSEHLERDLVIAAATLWFAEDPQPLDELLGRLSGETPHPWRMDTIEIVSTLPTSPVQAFVCGPFALIGTHEPWNVTHIPTGRRLARMNDCAAAVALVEALVMTDPPELWTSNDVEALKRNAQVLHALPEYEGRWQAGDTSVTKDSKLKEHLA